MKFKGPIELLRRYLSGNASADEKKRVEEWYASFDEKEFSVPALQDDVNGVKDKIYQRIIDELSLPRPVVPLYKRNWFRVTAAAVFIFLIAGSYFLFFQPRRIETNVLAGKQKYKNDVAPPVVNRAILTLADGSKIELDSSVNGILAVQGKINVVKQDDGLIAYSGGVTRGEINYNTLTVPRGSKPMKLLLADGSEVWLNVASSITYPTAFAGPERKVEISGEAYFEIAKNKEMPFIVKKKNDDVQVQVLGTHFNVNAYDDETMMKVTLLEGSVDVSKGGTHSWLKPGEQAVVDNDKINVINDADLEEVMAWKNGRFYFDGADIKTVMKQVEKWYDVDVRYEDDIPYSFVAKISRNVNASELFKILQLTELVHFRIEGNKITVMK